MDPINVLTNKSTILRTPLWPSSTITAQNSPVIKLTRILAKINKLYRIASIWQRLPTRRAFRARVWLIVTTIARKAIQLPMLRLSWLQLSQKNNTNTQEFRISSWQRMRPRKVMNFQHTLSIIRGRVHTRVLKMISSKNCHQGMRSAKVRVSTIGLLRWWLMEISLLRQLWIPVKGITVDLQPWEIVKSSSKILTKRD